MLSTGVAFLRNKDLMKFTHKPDIRERERERERERQRQRQRQREIAGLLLVRSIKQCTKLAIFNL